MPIATEPFKYSPGYKKREEELLRRWEAFYSLIETAPVAVVMNAVEDGPPAFAEYVHFLSGGGMS